MKNSYILSLLTISFIQQNTFLAYLLKNVNLILDKILNSHITTTIPISRNIPWKPLTIFLFIFFLPIAPESNIQLSAIPSANFSTHAINQKQFGIVIFSISNILLIPLIALLIREYKKIPISIFSIDLLMISFLILCQISVIYSINPQVSFVWFLKVLFSFAVYFIFSKIHVDRKIIMFILLAFIATIIYEFTLSFAQFTKGNLLGIPLENPGRIVVSRISYVVQGSSYFKTPGTFSHPNLLSAYLAILLPISIILMTSGIYFKKDFLQTKIPNSWGIFLKHLLNTASHKKVFYILPVIIIVTIIITLSRWGIATALFAFIITFVLIKIYVKSLTKKLFSNVKPSLIFIVLLISLFLINPFVSKRFLTFSLNDSSLKTRNELINQSLYTLQRAPWGIGGGASVSYLANYDITDTQISNRYLFEVHNLYLLIGTEIGIPGLILFIIIIIKIIIQFISRIKTINRELQIFAVGLFGSFLTFLFSGLWEPRYFSDRLGFIFFVLFGLLVNILTQNDQVKT